jgi:hypothetical protein
MKRFDMHRVLRYVALTLVVIVIGAPWLAAQKTQQFFVKVTGPSGAITDLQIGDLKVTEDDVACKVLKVEPAGPMKIQVLVDNSQVNTTPINGLRDGLQAFFEKMPEGVEMSMYTTAPQGRPIVKSTTDKKKLIDGIALIAPDRGVGAFFESLLDAVDRVNRDKTPGFPLLMLVGSDVGVEDIKDRDVQDVQQKIIKNAITIHVVLMSGGSNQSSRTGVQPEIGMTVTKLTGGQYENINAITRFATLLPEFGERIAQAAERQRNQFRVTYEGAAKRNASAKIGIVVARQGTVTTSLDGRIP